MTRLQRRLREAGLENDAGTSIAELLVGMLIMVIFMAIFTGAIAAMGSTINKVEAITTSTQQTNTAFLKLDTLVRYAGAITTAGQGTSGDWYVELDSAANDTSTETCTQLRVDIASQELQQRTWLPTGTTTYQAGSLTGWTALANNITNGTASPGSADQPFTVPAALTTAATTFQRLTVTVVAASAGASVAPSRSSMTFTSLNSAASASTNNSQCQQLGSQSRP